MVTSPIKPLASEWSPTIIENKEPFQKVDEISETQASNLLRLLDWMNHFERSSWLPKYQDLVLSSPRKASCTSAWDKICRQILASDGALGFRLKSGLQSCAPTTISDSSWCWFMHSTHRQTSHPVDSIVVEIVHRGCFSLPNVICEYTWASRINFSLKVHYHVRNKHHNEKRLGKCMKTNGLPLNHFIGNFTIYITIFTR